MFIFWCCDTEFYLFFCLKTKASTSRILSKKRKKKHYGCLKNIFFKKKIRSMR